MNPSVNNNDEMLRALAAEQVRRENARLGGSLDEEGGQTGNGGGALSTYNKYNQIKDASGAGTGAQVVTEASTIAPVAEIGTESALSTAPETSTVGATLGKAVPIVAAIKAFDMLRQDQGQLDRPYEDKGAFAKYAAAPATGLFPATWEAAGVNSSNYVSKVSSRAPKFEEKLVGEPLDKLFAGDVRGGVTDLGAAVMDLPGEVWGFLRSIVGLN